MAKKKFQINPNDILDTVEDSAENTIEKIEQPLNENFVNTEVKEKEFIDISNSSEIENVNEVQTIKLSREQQEQPINAKVNKTKTNKNDINLKSTTFRISGLNAKYLNYMNIKTKSDKCSFFNKFILEHKKQHINDPFDFMKVASSRRKAPAEVIVFNIRITEEVEEYIKTKSRERAMSASAFVDEIITEAFKNDKTINK